MSVGKSMIELAMALTESSKTPVGWGAPDFSLPGTDGEVYSLSSFADAKGLVVVFTCNHCPYAKASWPLLIELAASYKKKGVAFVAINPNDEVAYPEDNFATMQKRVAEWKINFPYLRDESQEVAKSYGAQCTPDIYLFDIDRKLYYRGRINDNWQAPDEAEEHNLEDAIDSLLAGENPPEDQPASMGCSIKWK